MEQKAGIFPLSESMPRRIFAVSGNKVRFLASATMRRTFSRIVPAATCCLDVGSGSLSMALEFAAEA
jgi:hypothetical protein